MSEIEFLSDAQNYSNLNPIDYQYFNQLLNHRTIILNEAITENILESVVVPLKNFEQDESTEPVTLILNTLGGSVADGLLLCNIIDIYKKPINIIVPSYACSMGTIILCSGNNNPNVHKACYQFSFALFHSGTTIVGGEVPSVEDVVEFNKNLNKKIRNYIITNTKISAEEYDNHERKQWYLTADDMKKYGLIHEIIGVDIIG